MGAFGDKIKGTVQGKRSKRHCATGIGNCEMERNMVKGRRGKGQGSWLKVRGKRLKAKNKINRGRGYSRERYFDSLPPWEPLRSRRIPQESFVSEWNCLAAAILAVLRTLTLRFSHIGNNKMRVEVNSIMIIFVFICIHCCCKASLLRDERR